jgi:hypothetical protein
LEKKKAYEKPILRKVRLEVKTSVLATCNTTSVSTAKDLPLTCQVTGCYTP